MGIKGEEERGQTARQPGRTHGSRQDKPRGHNRRHTAATEHTQTAGGAEDKRREGRKGGTRMALRLGSGGGEQRGTDDTRQQAGSRERRKEKEYVIYLRERRGEKHRRDSQKRASVCIYILLNIAAWWLFIALSFIYIRGEYIIYIYI